MKEEKKSGYVVTTQLGLLINSESHEMDWGALSLFYFQNIIKNSNLQNAIYGCFFKIG